MNSETYLDFCFIREAIGNLGTEIEAIFTTLFKGLRLHWYLDEKEIEGVEIVVAEVRGMSRWNSEEEALQFLEEYGGNQFWELLQGYQMYIYPVKRGCSSCDS